MSRAVLKARWVLPVSSPPIENGRVAVENGRIATVETATGPRSAATDLGDVTLLPGFVNPHTHLELSLCRGRMPFTGSFVGWIERLTSLYQHEDAGTGRALRRSIRGGLRQSLAAGVTTVADIGSGRRAVEEWHGTALNVVGLLEVLGIGPKRMSEHDRSVARVTSLCQQADAMGQGPPATEACGSLRRLGISPHAPYSTGPLVYREAIEFATRTHRPICTHLGETRDELRFLSDGTGPFREFLERLGLWDGSFSPPGCSPVEYARQLGLLACGSMLAHVNYATDSDLDILARGKSTVVYCPRSHRFFGHEPHRYRDMLDRDINVCVGTDSLASNDSLSVLDELRFLRLQDQQISGQCLLAMGTIAGARALGLDAETGSLEVGKRADLVAVPLTDTKARDPLADLLSGNAEPSAVYVGGQRLHPG